MSSHHPNKTTVPTWLVPAAAITFGILLTFIVWASRPCSDACHDEHKTEKKEHSSAPSTNGQGYVTVEGTDGNDLKVSQKLSGMIGYLVENDQLNSALPENTELQKKVDGWKEKMASNTTSPSFSNFLDIVELGKILSEK